MTFTILAGASLLCALCPAGLFCINLWLYRSPSAPGPIQLPAISVLIPARDEERSIEEAVISVLASRGVAFEVVVMDDGSTDRTAAIVAEMAQSEPRVRLEPAPSLPSGWNGKQHACWALAHVAKHPLLCFMDADVRLEAEALSRMAAFLVQSESQLVSGFPRQITGTTMEWLLLPLIHFALLGFLPIFGMRRGTSPSFAAGCGQFLMMDREAYRAAGGHSAIKSTMHDGLMLPKLFRAHGYRTDLADLTGLARCRMYSTAQQVWHGLAKNATEGIAAPARILPLSLVLLAGQVLPCLLALWLIQYSASETAQWCVIAAAFCAWLPRVLAVSRFRQDWRSAALHPFGIMALLMIQWYALSRKLLGGAVSWKDRAYAGK